MIFDQEMNLLICLVFFLGIPFSTENGTLSITNNKGVSTENGTLSNFMQTTNALGLLFFMASHFIYDLGFTRELIYDDHIKACQKNIAMACVSLGYAEDEQGKDEEAYQAFKKGCSLGEKLACFLTGTKEHKRGNIKEAFRLHTFACDKGEENSCGDLGLLYSQIGNLRAAKINHEKACSKNVVPSCIILANIEDESGNYQKAITLLRKVCPKDERACAYQGTLELKVGNKNHATKLLTRACSKNIGLGCSGLGLLKIQNGDRKGAVDLFRKACKLGVKEACEDDKDAGVLVDESLNLPADGDSSVCNLAIIGGTSRKAFDEFDKGLKSAASSGNPQLFSKFLQYPLRWNVNHRTKYISNEAEFKLVSEIIFNSKIRQTIKEQKGFFCRDNGIMYGRGTLWVDLKKTMGNDQYFIKSVNSGILDESSTPTNNAPETKLSCRTDKYVVLVEDIGNDKIRYKGWSAGKSLSSDPDLTIPKGASRVEGRGVCAYSIYTFKNGDYTYELQELGCTDGSEPMGTIGRLVVSKGSKELGNWPCKKM